MNHKELVEHSADVLSKTPFLTFTNLFQLRREELHSLSLELGEAYREAYMASGEEEGALLEAYRDVRRALPIEENGKRYRAWEAYLACNY
jgi:hypothetical protein